MAVSRPWETPLDGDNIRPPKHPQGTASGKLGVQPVKAIIDTRRIATFFSLRTFVRTAQKRKKTRTKNKEKKASGSSQIEHRHVAAKLNRKNVPPSSTQPFVLIWVYFFEVWNQTTTAEDAVETKNHRDG